MIGRRSSDVGSPGFRSFLVLVAILAAYVAIITNMPAPQFKTAKPIDACRDGVVKQWDGKEWHAVELKGKKRHLPCGGENGNTSTAN